MTLPQPARRRLLPRSPYCLSSEGESRLAVASYFVLSPFNEARATSSAPPPWQPDPVQSKHPHGRLPCPQRTRSMPPGLPPAKRLIAAAPRARQRQSCQIVDCPPLVGETASIGRPIGSLFARFELSPASPRLLRVGLRPASDHKASSFSDLARTGAGTADVNRDREPGPEPRS